MTRFRVIFLSLSVTCVILFAGLLRAGLDNEDREDLFRSLGILTEVVHLVENEYVDELNDDVLALSLDAGLVESIDPWAAAVPSERVDDYRRFLESTPPFGLLVAGRLGSAAVRQTAPGSAAEDAGLKAWEVIEQVDGVFTRGRPLWQIRLELAEKEASEEPVSLTIVDRFVDERREAVLEPKTWVPSHVAVTEHDSANIVRISGLRPGVTAQVAEVVAVDTPVILDLRDLLWGDEAVAIEVADLFVAEGEIGQWVGRRAGEKVFESTSEVATPRLPIVLIGPNTEGVGEILAAALQRAGSVTVGWQTAGHAPHMRFIHSDGLHLWIPVGQWMKEDATPINGNAIEPEHEVEPADLDSEDDPTLERALELIAGEDPVEIDLDEAA